MNLIYSYNKPVTRGSSRGLEEPPILACDLMFLFWVAFSFVCHHARLRTPLQKKSGYGPASNNMDLINFTEILQ